jgi:thioredoxin 1
LEITRSGKKTSITTEGNTMFEDKELEQIRQNKTQKMLNQASNHPLTITDDNFDNTVKTNTLIVVDFWAPWCGPCRIVGPVIEQLAAEYISKVTFGKVNVDENQTVARSFGVMSIPTIIVFNNGQEVERIVGAYPKTEIEATFKKYIKK